MGRLTELIEYYSWKVNELAEGYEIATRYMETGEIKEYNKGCQRIDDTLEALKELQHYKDLEEQGRLIEVIKCKDCSCFEEITNAYNYYFCNRYGGIVTENDYCSRAEAKLAELKGE